MKQRQEEGDSNLQAKFEYHRRLCLLKNIWCNQFPIEEQAEAKLALEELIEECRTIKVYRPAEYIGRVYESNGELTKVKFIKENLDKIHVLCEYILGYRPELEKALSYVTLQHCYHASQKAIGQVLEQNLELE